MTVTVRDQRGVMLLTHSRPAIRSAGILTPSRVAIWWGPSVCARWPGVPCSEFEARFYLHGVWPSRGTFCKPRQYSKDVLNLELQANLTAVMRDVSGVENGKGLWEHEWTKHGTCGEHLWPDEAGYFEYSLRAFHHYVPVIADLPVGVPLSLTSVAAHVYHRTGSKPYIACHGVDELEEVRFCFDDRTGAAVDCEARTNELAAFAADCNLNGLYQLRQTVT